MEEICKIRAMLAILKLNSPVYIFFKQILNIDIDVFDIIIE